MEKLKILTTGAGAPGARGILKSFRIGAKDDGKELRIIACDMDKNAYGFHFADKSYVIPPGNDENFIPKTLEICEREEPNLLVTWVDPELLPISKARGYFEDRGCKVVISNEQGVEISQNKARTYQAIEKLGLAPKFRIVNNSNQFRAAITSLGYPVSPVCFKPAFSYGMRGFRILKPDVSRADILFKYKPSDVIMNFEEAIDIFEAYEREKSLPEMLVMEYLEGREYSVDLLLKDGEPVITIPRERVVTKLGISNIARIENNTEVKEAAEKIAKELNLNYNINMQFRYSIEGQPRLIEVQPRLSGTVIACVGAGVNLPYLGIKLALGEKIKKQEIKFGTIVKRFWEEIYIKDNKTWFFGLDTK